MKGAFALKRPGAQESPVKVPKSVKRARIGHSNGTKIRPKRRQNQPKWVNGSQKRPPWGNVWILGAKRAVLGVILGSFLNPFSHKIDTKKHWTFDTKKHVFCDAKTMPKGCQNRRRKASQIWSKTDAETTCENMQKHDIRKGGKCANLPWGSSNLKVSEVECATRNFTKKP